MRKTVHKAILDLLTSPWAAPLVILITLLLGLAMAQILLRIPFTPICVSCSTIDYNDNIQGISFQDRLCLPTFDVVYTWVNGSDPKHLQNLQRFQETPQLITNSSVGMHRFRDNQELKYSLRSIWKYAPWVRQIFIVTSGHVPSWLNLDHPRLTLISHEQIFRNQSHLPTFSSPAIEANLHNIPGLSDKFMYFNDDVMLGNEVWPDDFYTISGGQKVFFAWNVPDCAPGCPDSWVGDGYCDSPCNVAECYFDAGDCANQSASTTSSYQSWSSQSKSTSRSGYCSSGCPNSWIGDKVCDRSCKNPECGWDGGDCADIDLRSELPVLDLSTTIKMSSTDLAVVVELNNTFDFVSDAERCDTDFIRAAVLRNPLHLMVIIFAESESNHTLSCDFSMNGSDIAGNDIRYQFTLESVLNYSDMPKSLDDSKNTEIEKNIGLLDHEDDNFGVGDETLIDSSRRLLSMDIDDNWDVETLQDNIESMVSVENIFLLAQDPRSQNGSIEIIPAENMTFEDWKLAEWIEDTKKKQLQLQVRRDLLNLVERELQNLSSIWPWDELRNKSSGSSSGPHRRLLDEFADSLRFVSSLYNTYFGRISRKVMAHMPHLIDKKIMTELQNIWPDEWDATSSHRFRHSQDMQYAFAYFYYLIQARKEFSVEQFFKTELDINNDGYLSTEEVEGIVRVLIKSKTLEFHEQLFNCLSDNENMEYVIVDLKALKSCEGAVEILRQHVQSQKRYKHQEGNTDDVTFFMVHDNSSVVKMRLDEIVEKKPKFLCLNDDMRNPTESSFEVLHSFYETYFPLPSPFELPESKTNDFLYIEDYKNRGGWTTKALGGFILFILALIYGRFRNIQFKRQKRKD